MSCSSSYRCSEDASKKTCHLTSIPQPKSPTVTCWTLGGTSPWCSWGAVVPGRPPQPLTACTTFCLQLEVSTTSSQVRRQKSFSLTGKLRQICVMLSDSTNLNIKDFLATVVSATAFVHCVIITFVKLYSWMRICLGDKSQMPNGKLYFLVYFWSGCVTECFMVIACMKKNICRILFPDLVCI